MCAVPEINQITMQLPVSFAADISPNEDNSAHKKQTSESKKKISPVGVLALYEGYLKKRIREAWPSRLTGNQLFKEITAKGYLGSISTLERFLYTVRSKEGIHKTSFRFYKDYLTKRIENALPDRVPINQLFEEITAQGYRGSLSTLETFLRTVREEEGIRKTSFRFYKDYLTKRVKDAVPECASTKQLFEEIIAKGYRGSLSTLEKFLCTVRKKEGIRKTSFRFYKDYLVKRLEGASPGRVSTRQLFKEIVVKGYRGSLGTLEKFLCTVRKKGGMRKTSLRFYKDYLVKRLEDASPGCVSTKQLFEEIVAQGYQGSRRTLQRFLCTVRAKEKMQKTSLHFHKDYLVKRVKDAVPDCTSTKQLFKEIKDQGYQGSLERLERFLCTVRKKEGIRKASLHFYKNYLVKRLENVSTVRASTNQLFEEIIAQGYRGSLRTLQRFLRTVRNKEEMQRTSLHFHKDYLA